MFSLSRAKIHVFGCFLCNAHLRIFSLHALPPNGYVIVVMYFNFGFVFLFRFYKIIYFNHFYSVLALSFHLRSNIWDRFSSAWIISFSENLVVANNQLYLFGMSLFHPLLWKILSLGLGFWGNGYFLSARGQYYSRYPSTDFWIPLFPWSRLSDSLSLLWSKSAFPLVIFKILLGRSANVFWDSLDFLNLWGNIFCQLWKILFVSSTVPFAPFCISPETLVMTVFPALYPSAFFFKHYIQHRAWAHAQEIKSFMFHQLSLPGAPSPHVFKACFFVFCLFAS